MQPAMRRAVSCALKTARGAAYLDVIYSGTRDGASFSVGLQAIKSEADVEVAAGDGTVVLERVTYWRILAEELVAFGKRIKPEEGDQVVLVDQSQRLTYELMPVAGDTCWEPTDPWTTGYKLHSKLVKEL